MHIIGYRNAMEPKINWSTVITTITFLIVGCTVYLLHGTSHKEIQYELNIIYNDMCNYWLIIKHIII